MGWFFFGWGLRVKSVRLSKVKMLPTITGINPVPPILSQVRIPSARLTRANMSRINPKIRSVRSISDLLDLLSDLAISWKVANPRPDSSRKERGLTYGPRYFRMPILMARGKYLLYSLCIKSQHSVGPR